MAHGRCWAALAARRRTNPKTRRSVDIPMPISAVAAVSRQFYAGGAIEEDNGAVARVRLRSANGVELEDTVEQGEVLFLSDDAIQTPLEVELYDGAGNLVGRHMTFNFAP